jgi:hypothetical protein
VTARAIGAAACHPAGMREPIPVATVVRVAARPGDPMSRSERAMLILTAVMLLVLLAVSVVLPYLPSTAAGW